MRIKMLTTVSRTELGMMSDLREGEVYNIDDELANKLIEDDKAEFDI
ncbi:hypothetical protein [Clostridium manihotivorum]|nr:hypothetical protein [Clostridium manihotivorum]